MEYLKGSLSNLNTPLGRTGQMSLYRNISEIKCNENDCPRSSFRKDNVSKSSELGASLPIPKDMAGTQTPHISPAMREDALFIPALSARVVVCVESLKQTKASCSQMLGGFQVHLAFLG